MTGPGAGAQQRLVLVEVPTVRRGRDRGDRAGGAHRRGRWRHSGSRLGAAPGAGLLDLTDLAAIGHRVVHGGTGFSAPTRITDDVVDQIRALVPLAPLRNPANLAGIEVARRLLPDILSVAVFDTAFHQTMRGRRGHLRHRGGPGSATRFGDTAFTAPPPRVRVPAYR